MTTSAKQTLLFGEDESTFSQVDSLVSRTQWLANEKAQKILDISGRKCLEQFESAGRPGLWARTFLGLLIGQAGWFSSRCALTWKVKGTKYNRLYCQLQVSTLRTGGIGFGLLPTCVSSDATTGAIIGKNDTFTPQKNGSFRKVNQKGTDGSIGLGRMVQLVPGLENQDSLTKRARQETGVTGQLSPHFVMEMMGFPPNWTELPFLNGETNQSKPEGMQ